MWDFLAGVFREVTAEEIKQLNLKLFHHVQDIGEAMVIPTCYFVAEQTVPVSSDTSDGSTLSPALIKESTVFGFRAHFVNSPDSISYKSLTDLCTKHKAAVQKGKVDQSLQFWDGVFSLVSGTSSGSAGSK